MAFDFQKTRDDAAKETAELQERQKQIVIEKKKLSDEEEQIKRRLMALEQIVEGTDIAISDLPPDLEPLGVTDQIRQILMQTSVPLFPMQIRELLTTQGITGSSPRNLLISVHTILDRLDEKGELEPVKMGNKVGLIAKGNPNISKKPIDIAGPELYPIASDIPIPPKRRRGAFSSAATASVDPGMKKFFAQQDAEKKK